MPSSALPVRPQTAPYLSRCGPSRLLAGLGDRAWAGERRRPRLAGSRGGASRRAPCSRPRVPAAVAAAASAPRTAPARPPPPRAPATVPGAPHPGPAAAQRLAPAPGRLRADFRERRGGSPSPRLPASHRHRLPLASVLPSTLQNQPTMHSGPSSREGRGGAGREVGEPGGDGGGGGARGAQLEPAFLLPGAKPSTPALLPCMHPPAMHAALGLLRAFWSSQAPKL